MKYIITLFIASLFFSCGKDKVIWLPEISHSKITDIKDVSAAYLFYDKKMPDSVDLNRKNLISTTNWLVNIDKRLTLKQVIPHIKFLQVKKENSSHKNRNSKNYFTCNDISKKNLGFIEFTDVGYEIKGEEIEPENKYSIIVIDLTNIIIFSLNDSEYKTNIINFVDAFNKILSQYERNKNISLSFNNKLLFQDYITFKSMLLKLDLKNVTISNHEYIIN
jgi:hypothetical protein